MDDDPTGIRSINSDLVGLKHKMKNIKEQRPTQRRKILNLVYYISAGKTRHLGFFLGRLEEAEEGWFGREHKNARLQCYMMLPRLLPAFTEVQRSNKPE